VKAVFDASAALAVLYAEAGSETLTPLLGQACISAVNLTEVVGKLAERGAGADDINDLLAALRLAVEPFDEAMAQHAGLLRPLTRAHGLSLGDRACLALAARLALPAYTTDAAWRDLETGVEIIVVR